MWAVTREYDRDRRASRGASPRRATRRVCGASARLGAEWNEAPPSMSWRGLITVRCTDLRSPTEVDAHWSCFPIRPLVPVARSAGSVARPCFALSGFPPARPPFSGDREICRASRTGAQGGEGLNFQRIFVSTGCPHQTRQMSPGARSSPPVIHRVIHTPPVERQRSDGGTGLDDLARPGRRRLAVAEVGPEADADRPEGTEQRHGHPDGSAWTFARLQQGQHEHEG